jgi:hypothetical protein
MSADVINALITIRNRINEQKKILADLRKQENKLNMEIQTYLVETGQQGIRLDTKTVIKLEDCEKKILMSKKDYKTHVEQLLYDHGVESSELIGRLLDKTSDIIQEQRLKFVKEK